MLVQLLQHLRHRGGAGLAEAVLVDEEVVPQVRLGHIGAVHDGERSDACEGRVDSELWPIGSWMGGRSRTPREGRTHREVPSFSASRFHTLTR